MKQIKVALGRLNRKAKGECMDQPRNSDLSIRKE